MMDNVQTTKPNIPATVDDPLQKLADEGSWDELAKDAGAIAIYNTHTLFIAALELAARGKNADALEASSHINPPMAALIRAIAENDLSIIINNPGKNIIADAWSSLAESVATRASNQAAMKYVSLVPIVTETNALTSAANLFFENRCWKPAAYIYTSICSSQNQLDVAIIRQLGISRYLSKDYAGAITAFSTAIEHGDNNPETLAYVTWLTEKFSSKEE